MTYEEWMKAVDEILTTKIGLSSSDLPDFPSRDLYDSEVDPMEGAESCLQHSEFPMELLND